MYLMPKENQNELVGVNTKEQLEMLNKIKSNFWIIQISTQQYLSNLFQKFYNIILKLVF